MMLPGGSGAWADADVPGMRGDSGNDGGARVGDRRAGQHPEVRYRTQGGRLRMAGSVGTTTVRPSAANAAAQDREKNCVANEGARIFP